MSLQKNRLPLYIPLAVPVILIILGAFAMSGEAVMENLRFIRGANQILSLVGTTRNVAAGQKNFADNPGEDIWADLAQAKQVAPSTTHPNPWQGDVRAVSAPPGAVRIESDLPARDCRRLALYFLGREPRELGLIMIAAAGDTATDWTQIYPANPPVYGPTIVTACGMGQYAHLALVFRVK